MAFFKNFTNSLGLLFHEGMSTYTIYRVYWVILAFISGFAGFILLYLISIPAGFWQKWSGTESATHPLASLFTDASTSLLITIAVLCLIIIVLYFIGGYKADPKTNPKIIKKRRK